MKEYLFRGKSLETGEWRYGILDTWKGGKQVGIVYGESYCFVDGDLSLTGGKSRSTVCSFDPVDETTICQWSGLYDSKGSRIFENDILGYTEGPCHISDKKVEGYEQGFWPLNYQLFGDDKGVVDGILVKGNIFDNPEYLKTVEEAERKVQEALDRWLDKHKELAASTYTYIMPDEDGNPKMTVVKKEDDING